MAYSFFALLDDIATLLDDVSAMTKVATQRTAGVLADDLALNAEQVTGVKASRELPVVWAVAKGSALNKVILVPLAMGISLVAHWAITPLLMIGGAYLCFEGFEKLAHRFLHPKEEKDEHHQELVAAVADPKVDLVAFEKAKIKGAIRTDFVLSAEIVVLAMGTAVDASNLQLFGMLVAISLIMTVGVYGVVAGIVRLDDVGLALLAKPSALARKVGRGLLVLAPWLMKFLSVAGTIAMFLVGGGILVHGVPPLDHLAQGLEAQGGVLGFALPLLVTGLSGVLAGALLVGLFTLGKKLLPAKKKAPPPSA